jgi:hypothetical protein
MFRSHKTIIIDTIKQKHPQTLIDVIKEVVLEVNLEAWSAECRAKS